MARPLILTVTLNFALDVTHHLPHFERGATSRVQKVSRRAGGKGVNVARTLHQLGREAVVTGLAGGLTGRAARDELALAGIGDELVEIEGESRLALMVVESDGQATGFSEPGPEVAAEEWRRFLASFRGLLTDADAVVLSGSVPPGLPAEVYAELIEPARALGVPTVLDADGEALERGVAVHPEIAAINEAELRAVVGDRRVAEGAAALRRAGAGAVVVSQGAEGLLGAAEDGTWVVAPPESLTGNPTGAGDAVSAALTLGLLDGLPWPERLIEATALSAAAVHAPLAGSFDAETYRRLRDQVTVRE